MATLGALGVVTLGALARMHPYVWFFRHGIKEYPGLSLPAALVRLPISFFAPATSLPMWGAVGQVILVVGAAEVLIGRRTTLVVGGLGHAAATLSSRFFIWLGPAAALGLPREYLRMPDTGPSAVTAALCVYLAATRRSPFLAVALGIWTVADLTLGIGLSEREHLVAALVALACAAVTAMARSRRRGGGRRAVAPVQANRALTSVS